jgi:heme-degrading monooxygenase HmoA
MDANTSRRWGYVILWEFRVCPEAKQGFEEAYGSGGIWERFFAQGEGYMRTELNQDVKDPERYLTLDFWASRESYEKFREQYQVQYKTIDTQCEELTQSEVQLGSFESV